MDQYRKALVALVTALGTWGYTVLEDDRITSQEWFGLCGVAVTVLGVWGAPNVVRIRSNPKHLAE